MIWPEQHTHEVSDGIFAVIQERGEMGVSNAAFIVEKQQAFVVDTMMFPIMAQGMLREIQRQSAHVEYVLNTHHHIDHIGGNAVFSDARLLGHPESIKALQRFKLPMTAYDQLMPHFRGHFADLTLIPPEPMEQAPIIPRSGELRAFTSAHTPTDVAVWFPEPRVLLAGDLCFFGVTPLAVHGHIGGWLKALNALLALEPAVIVPGHGRIGSQADLRILRDYIAALHYTGIRAVAEQLSLQEALKNFDPGPVAAWIENERTSLNLERAMQEARQASS